MKTTYYHVSLDELDYVACGLAKNYGLEWDLPTDFYFRVERLVYPEGHCPLSDGDAVCIECFRRGELLFLGEVVV